MKSRIVRIGNSQGIRIPKPLLEEAGLEGEVEIEVGPEGLRILPSRSPRDGWADAARLAAERGDDRRLDPETATVFDATDWTW